MNNSNFSPILRDAQQIIIHRAANSSCLNINLATATAVQLPLPTLAYIAVTHSGIILIGPENVVKHCRDPVDSTK